MIKVSVDSRLEYLRSVSSSVWSVLQVPKYSLLALGIAGSVLLLSIWLPNLRIITWTLGSDSLSLEQKSNILIAFLGGFQTNFTVFSRATTILIAVLFGVNISVLIFYLKKRFSLEKSVGTSIGGIVSGLLGVGCASCGSVILSSIFGLGATAGFLGLLPLRGQEFALLGIVVLTVSTGITARKIQDPLFCKV